MFSFKKEYKPVIGVDISRASVKLIELGRSGGKYQVKSHAVERLPEDVKGDKALAEGTEAVGNAIARALKKSGSRVKHGAVAVPGTAAITRVISMPAGLSEDEMESQIQLEADQYIPFPVEEVNMDFEVLGMTEGSDTQVDVLLAASKGENVDFRVEALEIGGLEAKVVDIEAFALENSIALIAQEIFGGGEDQIIAVADIGSAMTSFSVLDSLKIVYSRDQEFGGNQLTEDIQRRYGLSLEEANVAQKQGGLPDNYEQEVLRPFMTLLAQEVSRAQQFFFSSGSIDHIDRLLLAGGCAAIPNLGEVVQTEVGLPTEVCNPFINMRIASGVSGQALKQDAPALMVACGLALRGFD